MQFKKDDMVQLTSSITMEEPTMKDGETITIPKGWIRKFIRYTEDEKSAVLEYMPDIAVTIEIPVDILTPANK